MNKSMPRLFAAAALMIAGLMAVVSMPSTAEAAIKCKGQHQVTKTHGLILTPYCEANYLAHVARKYYGVRVSGGTLRNNINKREQVCRFVGHDSRVRHLCAGFLNQGRGRRWAG